MLYQSWAIFPRCKGTGAYLFASLLPRICKEDGVLRALSGVSLVGVKLVRRCTLVLTANVRWASILPLKSRPRPSALRIPKAQSVEAIARQKHTICHLPLPEDVSPQHFIKTSTKPAAPINSRPIQAAHQATTLDLKAPNPHRNTGTVRLRTCPITNAGWSV